MSQMLCGWAMASALTQHSLNDLAAVALNVSDLQRRREKFVAGLRSSACEVHVSEGVFYLTPKSSIKDDVRFVELLVEQKIFCLPGSIVNTPGYCGVSISANDDMIDRALPKLATGMKGLG